jgi:hypothetical protein
MAIYPVSSWLQNEDVINCLSGQLITKLAIAEKINLGMTLKIPFKVSKRV